MIKQYKAKISYGMLIFIFILLFVPVIYGIMENGVNIAYNLLLLLQVICFAFLLYLFFSTNYTIENSELRVKFGFLFYKKIDINAIKTVRKTNSLLSSPAPSFDRIIIKYGEFDEIILSPKDKVSFVKSLKSINPKIKSTIINN